MFVYIGLIVSVNLRTDWTDLDVTYADISHNQPPNRTNPYIITLGAKSQISWVLQKSVSKEDIQTWRPRNWPSESPSTWHSNT